MFRASKYIEEKEGRTPLLDYIETAQKQIDFSNYAQVARKKRLKYLVLRTPELAGMLWDIAEDIAGRFDFIPLPQSRTNGRNRVLNAKRWTRNTEFRDTLLSVVFDALATGEGYIFLGSNATAIMSEIARLGTVLQDKLLDESVLNPMFKPISSTTMNNVHDDVNLRGYSQLIHGSTLPFNVKEIIHIFFKRLPGKIDGFTLVSTIPLQLELLWLLWTNQYDLQAKGNTADFMVIAEDIKSNTPALQALESKLKKYNMPGNAKHGTTVLYGGKYSFEKMERDTSLQFEDVGKAITSVMASLFRYPKHRLGIKTKESASDKDSQGNGDRDYWDMIEKNQNKLSDIFDTQLFEPFFGVQLVFDKSYKHDSVVENTAMRSRIDNVNLVNGMLLKHEERLPKEDVLRFIQGKDIDFKTEELPKDQLEIAMAQILPMAGTPANQKDEQLSKDKKKDQKNTEKNTGGVNKQ